jgi:N-acetylglutamate synthase-like GNAT family acetyltransferase
LIEKGYHPFVANAKEDVPELVDFLKKAFRDSPIPSTKSRDERIQEFQTILQEGGYIYLIRDNKNQIVGSAVLHTDAKNLGYIRSVGVDEHHRGKKIATTMMQGLIAEAKRRHFPKVELSPETPQARALYEKLGFETYDEKLIHHQKFPVMRLYLKEPNKGWGSWLLDGIQSAANWIYGKVKAFLSGMFSFFSAKQ